MPQTSTNLTPEERVAKAVEAFNLFDSQMEALMAEERDLVQKLIKDAEDSKIKEVLDSIMKLYDRRRNSSPKS